MKNISEILSIYERLIFGDLRPWIPENLEEEKFTNFLHPSINIVQPVGEELIKTLEENIKKHPLFADIEFCELKVDNESNSIIIADVTTQHFDGLVDISIPPYFNDKTEYYYFVLKLVNVSILKTINEIYTNSSSKEDFSFFLNKLFGRLKHIINEAHLKLKSINYIKDLELPLDNLDSIDKQKKVDYYILYATRERLIQLILEINSFYNEFFNNEYLTEKEIYHTILNDRHPLDIHIFKMHKFESSAIQNLIKRLPEYSLSKVHNSINRNKQCLADLGGYTRITEELTNARNSLLTNIQVLENLIFYVTYINDGTALDMDILSNSQTEINWYNIHKSSIQEKLKEYSLSIDAIDFLKQLQIANKSLFSDAPLHPSVKAKSSIIRRLDDWLSEQINFYKANLAVNPSALQIPDSSNSKIPTNLSVKELAFLFKALYELKIIPPQTKTDLFKQIASNFTTKGNDELSWKSIKNHFDTPDQKTADEWVTYFTQLMQFSKKFRENS